VGIIEQIIGILIIGTCFAVGLLYVAPKTIKDVIQIIKDVLIDGNDDEFVDDFNVAERNEIE